MVTKVKILTAIGVQRLGDGIHHDGQGLYLVVRGRSRLWMFRYTVAGKRNWISLGSTVTMTLLQARFAAQKARECVASGNDPIAVREAQLLEKQSMEKAQLAEVAAEEFERSRQRTFFQCASAYIGSHEAGWRNKKHAQQWRNTLDTYCSSVFGDMIVQEVNTELVMKVLEPIWTKKPETAARVRSRIELILDWARARGLRSGENPARWRGHLDALLPARARIAKVKHRPALAWQEVGAFMLELKGYQGVAARALEFLILTASRVSEVVNANWEEFDVEARVWTIPEDRMKAGRTHRVPLSDAALDVLSKMEDLRKGDMVFPGWGRHKALTIAAPLALLQRGLNRPNLTVHGFRSTFRDWCAEATDYPRELAEAALAHAIANKTEAAYLRSDRLDKRRQLMQEWADFCNDSQHRLLLREAEGSKLVEVRAS